MDPKQAQSQPAQRSSVTILVVEDGEANRLLMLRQLERLGYRAVAVRDGFEAIEAVAGGGCALVLMDCQMPGMDGLEATRTIRKREADGAPRVPIVAITAGATAYDREACFAAGMDDVITKPVMVEALGAAVSRWVQHGGGEERSPTTVAAEAHAAGDSGLDAGALARLRDEIGEASVGRFVDAYLRELPGRVAAVREAVEERDAGALRRAAHALRSPSAAVGATAFAGICERLETIGREGATADAGKPLEFLEAECEAVRVILERECGEVRS